MCEFKGKGLEIARLHKAAGIWHGMRRPYLIPGGDQIDPSRGGGNCPQPIANTIPKPLFYFLKFLLPWGEKQLLFSPNSALWFWMSFMTIKGACSIWVKWQVLSLFCYSMPACLFAEQTGKLHEKNMECPQANKKYHAITWSMLCLFLSCICDALFFHALQIPLGWFLILQT